MAGPLETLDLNLLRVFAVIMREGSITAAGAVIGQTQSSMSHALSRLRQHLGDPLFVRTANGVQPTPFAVRLSASVSEAFEALRVGIDPSDSFDPATSTRSYSDYVGAERAFRIPCRTREERGGPRDRKTS